jgi:hypothetical protein
VKMRRNFTNMENPNLDEELYSLIISKLSDKEKYIIITESLENNYRFYEAKKLLNDLIENIKDIEVNLNE